MQIFRGSEEQWLRSTGKSSDGNIHIPVSRAMEILAQRGLPQVSGPFQPANVGAPSAAYPSGAADTGQTSRADAHSRSKEVKYGSTIRKALVVITMTACASISAWSQAAPKLQPGDSVPNTKPAILDQVGLDQRLNQQVPLDLAFNDESGQAIQLQQYFGQKPVILMLVYYQCPMLCTQVLSGFTGAMLGIRKFDIGREFNVVTVSIDPRDKPADAAATKERYIKRYRRAGAAEGWHFLTGKKDQIDALAQAVGFRYAWDPANPAVCACQRHYAAHAARPNRPVLLRN